MNRKQRWADAAVHDSFNEAVRHHRAGRLNEAFRLYGEVLVANPRHADSFHLLGVAASQMGRHDLAIDLISQAIAINGTVASYRASLGNALAARGSLDEAAACYRSVIEIEPDNLEAQNNLGNA